MICSISANIAVNTKIKFQILKSMIVPGGLVVTVSMVILLYEAIVANSLLSNHRLVVWTDLRQGAWGSLSGPGTLRTFV